MLDRIKSWLKERKGKAEMDICELCEGRGKIGHQDCYPSKGAVKIVTQYGSYYESWRICDQCEGTGKIVTVVKKKGKKVPTIWREI